MAIDEPPDIERQARATLERFVGEVLRKLNREQLEECVHDAPRPHTNLEDDECGDSYAESIVDRLLGGWQISDYIHRRTKTHHAALLESEQAAKEKAYEARRLLGDTRRMAKELRSLADEIERQVPPESA